MEDLKQEIESILEYLKLRKGRKGEEVAEKMGLTRMQMYGRINSKVYGTVKSVYDALQEMYETDLRDYKPSSKQIFQKETVQTSHIDRLSDMEKKYIQLLEERAAKNEGISREEFREAMEKVLGEFEDLRNQIKESIRQRNI